MFVVFVLVAFLVAEINANAMYLHYVTNDPEFPYTTTPVRDRAPKPRVVRAPAAALMRLKTLEKYSMFTNRPIASLGEQILAQQRNDCRSVGSTARRHTSFSHDIPGRRVILATPI